MNPLDDMLQPIRDAVDAFTDSPRKPFSNGTDIPSHIAEGDQPGWMAETTLHPLGIAMLMLAVAMVIGGKRTTAVLALLLFATCVSGAQNLNILGTSWYLLRVLILSGLFRCLVRGDWKTLRWQAVDGFVLAWTIAGTFIYFLQQGHLGALVYKAGTAIDCAGAYFVFRGLLQDQDAVVKAIRSLAVIAVPVAAFFVFESITQYNLFSIFGGVAEITVEREGRLRCQGPFSHPILAGVYWATLFPAFAALVLSGRSPVIGAIGSMASLVTIVCSASSTPVMGVAAGLFGMSTFLIRRQIRYLVVASVATLFVLHMVMKAPVWHLLARSDIIGGSTGHYRYMLFDAAVRFFSEWWLFGLASNEHWGRAYGHYLTDITNQYVLEGLRGGLLTLVLFLGVIWFAFSTIGHCLREKLPLSDEWMVWSLGVGLFVHCVSFVAVAYFGQIIMLYYFLLAMIVSLPTAMLHKSATMPTPLPARVPHIPLAARPVYQYPRSRLLDHHHVG